MINIQDRLLMKPLICDFTVLVLSHAVVVLLLTQSCGGQHHVIGSPQPIVAMVGDDVILPCHLEPAADAFDLTVEWARPDLDPRFVHLRRDGVELPMERNPSYFWRTSLFINKLKCGDISLKISKLKLSDAGTYRCLLPKYSADYVSKLVVGSVSSPEIVISKLSSGVVLKCKSKGWYPEPEVLWLDGEGNLVSAGPTETVRGPDDLYTVSSRVTVDKRHGNRFTCRLQQNNINQTRETHIEVTDDFFTAQSSSSVRITIILVACSMCVLTIFFIVWKINKNKMKEEKNKTFSNSTEVHLLIEAERKHLMTESEKVTYLEKNKAALDEKLEKKHEELQHVEHVITTLTEQKKDLKNQREKLIQLLQEVKTKQEEIKKKLEKKTKTQPEKKKQKRKDTKKELERTKAEYEELLQNTEKLLESTEKMINEMTERKGKSVNEREQFDKLLKETEKEKDVIQKKLEAEREEEENNQLAEDPQSD